MNKRLEISIPKSCPENWDSMLPVAGGNYCASCQKKVTDFTGFSEKALQEWFLLHQGEKICGRFLSSQLALQPEELPKASLWTVLRTKILAASVLIFPFTLKASSNALVQKQKIEAAPVSKHTPHHQTFEKQLQQADSITTIKGVILDKATKEIISGVEIMVKGTMIKSYSDDKGNFQISFNKDIRPMLMMSALGYHTLVQEVRMETGKPVTIMLIGDSSKLMGEVCITRKSSFWKAIIRPIKKIAN